MKKIFRIIILLLVLIPSLVLADGIELEFIEPNYNTNQLTYINGVEKPMVFDFTFTPESKEMVYKIKLKNTTTQALYITDIDHTTDSNVIITYTGIKKADVLQPGEDKYVTIKFEMATYPTAEYTNQITFYFKYDLAENHRSTQEVPSDPGRRSTNSTDYNPETGLIDVVVIVVPFIIVLSCAYLIINKKDKIFKTFIILLIPITTGLIITRVYAEKTEGTVVITGNVSFKTLPIVCTTDEEDTTKKQCNGTIEDYDVYTIEIDPNGGLYNNSSNVTKANYLKNHIIDLSDIDRIYYKFINWTYNGEEKTFANDELKVVENAKLVANWEYGPYYKVEIDPNGGIYNGSTKVFKTKIKEGESIDVGTVTREGYVFYRWDEVTSTSSYHDNKIKMSRRDVKIKARWEGIYTLTFDKNADDAICNVLEKEVTNMFEIGTLPTPTREGYVFDGWFIGDKQLSSSSIFTEDKDSTAVAHWTPRSDTKYIVNHYLQKPLHNADVKTLENYTLDKTDTYQGVTDSEVEPVVYTYPGYDAPEVQKVTVLGNGKRVVDYYYYVRRFNINVTLPAVGIQEVKYKINGSDEYKSLTSTGTLKVEFGSRYDLYAVAAPGFYHVETGPTNTFNGTMGETDVPFNPTVTSCPAGHKCEEGSHEPEKCQAGTYAQEGSGECKQCDGGTHASSAGSDHCDLCLAGTACPPGSKDPITCPAGTIAATAGSSECTPCSEGTYASLSGSTKCSDCPAGSKCALPSPSPNPVVGPIKPEKCPAGTYSGEKSKVCDKCEAGTYSEEGSSECHTCEAGTAAAEGSGSCTTCQAGYYSSEKSGECKKCQAGTYSSSPKSSSCTTCPAGHKCEEGSSEPETCPAGTYAEEGSGKCTSCPAGTHASSAGSDHCDKCPAGTKCSGGTKDPETCPAGTYAEEGSGECKQCKAGTYNPSTGASSCLTCPAGSECPTGSPNPTVCSAGTYSDSDGLGSCKQCEAGTYQNEKGKTSCKICLAGTACPTGSTNPTDCNSGYYSDADRLGSCKKCSANTYSPTGIAATGCTPCGVGKESSAGSSSCSLKRFNVQFIGGNSYSVYSSISTNPVSVPYGSSNSTRITPNAGYYITGITCTNGYTNSYTDSYLNNNPSVSYSTVTVYNPGVETGSTCTYTITRITASMLTFTPDYSSYTTCGNAQCAIDDLYSKIGALGL